MKQSPPPNREKKITGKIYEVVSNDTDFRVGTWIFQKGRKLYVIADKEKFKGARMVRYYSKFVQWRNKNYILPV